MTAITVCSDFENEENKFCHCFHFFPIYLQWSDRTRCHGLFFFFFFLRFKPAVSLFSFILLQSLFSFPLFPGIRVASSAYLRCWYFFCQSWSQLVIHPAQDFTWYTLHISSISKVTIYSLDVLLSQFWTSPLFCWFLTLHRSFSGDR